MSILSTLIDFILHIDVHLVELIGQYGNLIYGIVGGIIFVETGLVIMPFLPGDSLLFAAGALAAQHAGLNAHLIFVISAVAAIIGDTLNYHIGKYVGPKAFSGRIRYLKVEHLERTQEFFEKHGGKAIIYARFVPIIRTFAPFVAGIGKMSYKHFIAYNIVGGVVRTAMFTYAGFFFGNIERVKENFSKVIIGIILLSVIPIIGQRIRHKFGTRNPVNN